MMKPKSIIVGVGALLLAVAVPAGAPEATGVPRIPLTCGLVVTHDAYVYLQKDLTCSTTFGVNVTFDLTNPDPFGDPPHVTIDLRGHTLRGPGSGQGISADTLPSSITFVAKNGRIKNWGTGVSGDGDVKNLRLVNNTVGFDCSEASCRLDRTTFVGSTQVGLHVNQATATVTRSAFIDNARGASLDFTGSLEIDLSVFTGNGTGVTGSLLPVSVSRTLFVGNDVAIFMDDECAILDRVKFKRNGEDVVGSTCATPTS